MLYEFWLCLFQLWCSIWHIAYDSLDYAQSRSKWEGYFYCYEFWSQPATASCDSKFNNKNNEQLDIAIDLFINSHELLAPESIRY